MAHHKGDKGAICRVIDNAQRYDVVNLQTRAFVGPQEDDNHGVELDKANNVANSVCSRLE